MTVQDVFNIINEIAPFDTQMGFDNAGLLIGSAHKEIHKIGVVLDVTADAVLYAQEQGIDLIISHHPVIFSGLKSINENSPVYLAIQHGIGVIS
ncbi:MAG: Nif3-like dinuclear metal center hexameric protein, partial [Clostridia bacterium]|nr:Nif3-like dinuclear metal center hexameric protein [Clostridia bacterium]